MKAVDAWASIKIAYLYHAGEQSGGNSYMLLGLDKQQQPKYV